MNLIAYFSSAGTPSTGLTPTIDIWEDTGTQIITSGSMTEMGGGFYKYNFVGYSASRDYGFRADGGSTLFGADRYVASTNEIGQIAATLSTMTSTLATISSEIGLGLEQQLLEELKRLVQGVHTKIERML